MGVEYVKANRLSEDRTRSSHGWPASGAELLAALREKCLKEYYSSGHNLQHVIMLYVMLYSMYDLRKYVVS